MPGPKAQSIQLHMHLILYTFCPAAQDRQASPRGLGGPSELPDGGSSCALRVNWREKYSIRYYKFPHRLNRTQETIGPPKRWTMGTQLGSYGLPKCVCVCARGCACVNYSSSRQAEHSVVHLAPFLDRVGIKQRYHNIATPIIVLVNAQICPHRN